MAVTDMGAPGEWSGSAVVSYEGAGAAEDYRRWDDGGAWLLGYHLLPWRLRLGESGTGRLVDLGCGPGEVSRWIADRFPELKVTGADPSAVMLSLARRHNAHPRVEYRQVTDGAVRGLRAGSADFVTVCFVFNCVTEQAGLEEVLEEAARLLQPGGRLAILAANPAEAHGRTFEGFRRGRPGASYRAGEKMPVEVRRVDGSWQTVTNVFWPAEVLRERLVGAGFCHIDEWAPVLSEARGLAAPELLASRAWREEEHAAPFLHITASR